MRYHIWIEGCQMNEADSDKLAAGLARLGWQPAAGPEDADLAVVNTCVVRQKAENRAVSYLGHLRRIKQARDADAPLRIAVTGCIVGAHTDELRARFPYVDAWARPQRFDLLIRHLAPGSDLGGEFWPHTFPQPSGPTAFVPVIHGCNKFCSFCIVPYRRGRERSRTIADVACEVASHCSRGVREVTLLGQTVEAYGKDLDAGPSGSKPDLADLFAAIHDTPKLQRIRFLTSYPRDMTERIVRSVADLPKVCEHFNIPVQAADNDVLARMRRGYTIEEYTQWVDRIRDVVPDATLSTDVIVGFCGETDSQFHRTLDLLEQLRFDKVHVAAYSPRPGTFACRYLEDDVPHDEKMRRLHAVEALQERIAAEINHALLDTAQEVLVESENDGVLTGRTRSNKLVHWRRPSRPCPSGQGEARPGDLVNVRVTHASPWALRGAQVEADSPVGAAPV